MTQKTGSMQKPRKKKTSYAVVNGRKVKNTPNGGGGKVRLTGLQKALIAPNYFAGTQAKIRRAMADRRAGK